MRRMISKNCGDIVFSWYPCRPRRCPGRAANIEFSEQVVVIYSQYVTVGKLERFRITDIPVSKIIPKLDLAADVPRFTVVPTEADAHTRGFSMGSPNTVGRHESAVREL